MARRRAYPAGCMRCMREPHILKIATGYRNRIAPPRIFYGSDARPQALNGYRCPHFPAWFYSGSNR
jgi:hypothetical protein